MGIIIIIPLSVGRTKKLSRSVMSNSLRPQRLYSPWNSPGENTRVGSRSLLPSPGDLSNPGIELSHIAGRFFNLSHKGSLRILEWVAYPFSRDLPDPGIKPGSLALKADSFPSELQGSRPPPPIYTSPIHDYYSKFI